LRRPDFGRDGALRRPVFGRDGALRRPRRRAKRQATELEPCKTAGVQNSVPPCRAETPQRGVPTIALAPSLPQFDLPGRQVPRYFSRVDLPRRKTLPHEIPLWIDPRKEIYFITINCRVRCQYGGDGCPGLGGDGALHRPDIAARCPCQGNQLALPDVSGRLLDTVRHRQEKGLWWPHVFLLMPDHLHALMSFPPSGKPLQTVVSKWKEWTAKEIGIDWQRDFFEHRLRNDESRRQKADYILQNPVRKKLVARPEDWPFVYFADGQRPCFEW
jgi:REP element-mobilizing transposase RayT